MTSDGARALEGRAPGARSSGGTRGLRPSGSARIGEPTFTVLGAEPVPHTLTPTLRFDLHVSEPLGRELYAIALSVQIQLDPARRTYDDATRARLSELFGAPERWGATTHSFQWARIDAMVPGFSGATAFSLELPCSYDLELAASKYLYSLPGGAAPLSFHFSGMALYRGEHDRLQVAQVPWSCTARWSLPVQTWKRAIDLHYPGGGWVRLAPETLDALAARKAERGDVSFDACVAGLLR